MGYRQGDEIGSPVKPLVARRVIDVQKDYWNESVTGKDDTYRSRTYMRSIPHVPPRSPQRQPISRLSQAVR